MTIGSAPATTSAQASARLTLYLAVGVGSAIGGLTRWWLSELMQAGPGGGFPWGTFWVNLSGSFLVGCYAGLVRPGGRLVHGVRRRLFFMTGFCGGYTSFSVFSLEAMVLVQHGQPGLAGLYVSGSVLLWLGAVWVGYALASLSRRSR